MKEIFIVNKEKIMNTIKYTFVMGNSATNEFLVVFNKSLSDFFNKYGGSIKIEKQTEECLYDDCENKTSKCRQNYSLLGKYELNKICNSSYDCETCSICKQYNGDCNNCPKR